MLIRIPKGWQIPEREATTEQAYLDRRKLLGGASAAAVEFIGESLFPFLHAREASPFRERAESRPVFAARRNPEYKVDRPVTAEEIATSFNNYYEFTLRKDKVKELAKDFPVRPWEIEIRGLVEKPRKLDVDDLLRRFVLEERVYRHRCVEAWSMVVPWVGFPVKRFVEWCRPLAKARYVRMVSFLRPSEAVGQRAATNYPWPYHEGLTLAEATNELTLLVVGMYGKVLPNQNGSPLRLIAPWKYGFKGIKGITRFEFVESQPPTFWSTVNPHEYDFWAIVDPHKPHPRWSQATELVVETRHRIPTVLYNGYGQYVAHLYKS